MSESLLTDDGAMLWTLEEISRLISHNGRPAKTLDNIVELIQRRFQTDVCSVYLLEPDRASLVLAATVGLRGDSVGRVRMRLDEGLVGLVAEQVKPIMVEDATRHPRFKYFREAGEEAYHSFLGVPLLDRGLLQGVLIVQTAEPRAFSRVRLSSNPIGIAIDSSSSSAAISPSGGGISITSIISATAPGGSEHSRQSIWRRAAAAPKRNSLASPRRDILMSWSERSAPIRSILEQNQEGGRIRRAIRFGWRRRLAKLRRSLS